MERSKLLLVIATLAGGIAASITSAIFNSVSKDKISTWIFYCKSGAWPSTSTSAEFSPQFCTEYETLLNNVWGSIGIPVGQTGLIIIYIFTLISLSRKNMADKLRLFSTGFCILQICLVISTFAVAVDPDTIWKSESDSELFGPLKCGWTSSLVSAVVHFCGVILIAWSSLDNPRENAK